MSSPSKIDANRRNARKSTGPKTPSGKAIASMNAVKHGLCSRKPLIPGEDEAEFAQFTSEWVRELQPAGAHQQMLAEQIIMSAWQLRRVPLLEAGLLSQHMRQDGEHPFAMKPEAYQQLSRLDRHQATLQKTIQRAMKELKELQELSTDGAQDADEQNEATEVQVPDRKSVV